MCLPLASMRVELRRCQDGAQRIAQVMGEQRAEHLIEPERLGTLLEILREPHALAVELEEYVRLVLENMRLDRLVDEIHRSGFVALEDALRLASAGRHEDDGHVTGPLASPHQLCELEAIHLGHLHVQERQSEIVDQKELQRLGAGLRGQGLDAVTLQQGRQRE
jgi:hypothetical protein